MKYYDEEAKELKELGEIPEHIKINEGDFFEDEDGIEYVGAEEEKDEDDLDIDTIWNKCDKVIFYIKPNNICLSVYWL